MRILERMTTGTIRTSTAAPSCQEWRPVKMIEREGAHLALGV